MSPKSLPLPPLPLIVLDTETTGFVPRVHRVIEFASMEIRGGKMVKEYEQLLTTEEIPPVVQVITRIKPEHLKGKPTFAEKREEILKHIPEDAIVVGQNTNFDIGMLKGEEIDLTGRPMLDTSMLASLVFPELESYSLGYLSRVLNLNHNPPHRALGDVRATMELLSKCWERLCELPEKQRAQMQEIGAKAPAGLKMLLEALPEATAKKAPKWFKPVVTTYAQHVEGSTTIDAPAGGIAIREESLDTGELRRVLEGALQSKGPRTWIAVKNLRIALERLPEDLEERGVRVFYPPHLLLDPAAKKRLLAQDTFTNDEATLALKLTWFPAKVRMPLPIHGGEEAVWKGKLAATAESGVFTKQCDDLPSVVLLEHQDLLQMVENENHSGHACLLKEPAHVIIDDASMLEDTATKAYGWNVSLDTLRAAAEGEELLTRFLDTFQMWIERVRQFQDLRYLTPHDLNAPEAAGLRDLLTSVMKGKKWTLQIQKQFEALGKILEPKNLNHRITWIEQNRQGSQFLQSVPERIGLFLQEHLFSRVPTTLLIPAGSGSMLPEILPEDHAGRRTVTEVKDAGGLPVFCPEDLEIADLFEQPPMGKSIVLLSSRSQIDDVFVKHTEILESKGVTLICQGSSGGQGRMQSEFTAAPGTALWLLTPWMFEGIDLPPGTTDRLILASLPFDHPSHAVLSRRAQLYRDAFNDYSLPRLLHRLFRLLRTFCRVRKENGEVLLLDTRLQTKSYGKKILTYLSRFHREPNEKPTSTGAQMTMF